ncbi:MAG: hypothetical protein J0L97_10520, partial [Alphaproteobacteria bacterium]|nr:hypothetical protein [Alphaproteobacteria bacterium]
FEQSGSFRLSLRSPSGTQISLGNYDLTAGTQNQRDIFINTYAFFGESSGSGDFTFVLEGITGNEASMHSVTIDAAQLQAEGYAGYSLDEMLNPSLTLWSMLSPSRVWNEAATSPEVIAAAEALFAGGLSQDDRALLESFKIINLEEYLFLLDPEIPLNDRLDALDQLAELFEQNGHSDAARRIDRVNFAFEALSTAYNSRATDLNAVEDALFNSATYLQAIGNRTAEEELLLRALVGSPGYPEEGLLTTLHRESQTVLINASQEGGNLVEGRRALQNIQQNLLPRALAFMTYEASLEGEHSLLQQIYGGDSNTRIDEFHNVITKLEETIPIHLQPRHTPGEYLAVLEQQFSQVPQIH